MVLEAGGGAVGGLMGRLLMVEEMSREECELTAPGAI